jgi:hypothetical protein
MTRNNGDSSLLGGLTGGFVLLQHWVVSISLEFKSALMCLTKMFSLYDFRCTVMFSGRITDTSRESQDDAGFAFLHLHFHGNLFVREARTDAETVTAK